MITKRRMTLFFLVSILFSLAASFAHPVTPTLFQNLGMADYLFGYALASMQLVSFMLSPFWGKINTFISCRVSMLISCIGYALGQFFFAIATTETQFILARAFAGIFTGGTFVSILNYVINVTKDERQRGVYLTASATIQSVAGAFGFFVGGMLGAIDLSYALIAQVITLALCGFLFYFVCVDDVDPMIKGQGINWGKLVREANPFTSFVTAGKFMTIALAILFASSTFHSLGQTAFDQSFNYYIKDQFNFSSAYNGALKAAMGIITLIANSTICVYLINKTDVRKSIVGLLGLCSVTMLAIINTDSIIPFLTINVFFYAFAAICVPLLQNIAAKYASSGGDSNLVMGFYNSIKSLGGIIGAAASGSLYTLNPKYPFFCSLLAFAVATILAYFFYQSVKKRNYDTV